MRENLTCEGCQRELIAFLDGALTKSVARVVERHVSACPRCGAALADYRDIADGLRRMPLLMAPHGLEDRVARALAGRRTALTGWQRFGAALGAVSFALTVGLLASLPRIAQEAGLRDPKLWLVSGMDWVIKGMTSLSKWLANEVAFYDPIAKQVWLAIQSLRSVPRVVIESLLIPEVQVAGAIVVTLGLALYLILRPSRSHEGSVGHVCLSL